MHEIPLPLDDCSAAKLLSATTTTSNCPPHMRCLTPSTLASTSTSQTRSSSFTSREDRNSLEERLLVSGKSSWITRRNPTTLVLDRIFNPSVAARYLHIEFIPGTPTWREYDTESSDKKPVSTSTFTNRPSHSATTPSSVQILTSFWKIGDEAVKNCAPWSNCRGVPSGALSLRVDILPPTPRPDSNTVTLKPLLASVCAHESPEIPAPTTAAVKSLQAWVLNFLEGIDKHSSKPIIIWLENQCER
mmetsp:Transcript_17224/g.23794  ORF Transcript_17224/g.23794 Transcript_17224/m.23794 type:complete len:246 (-) Transcript_17224:191-928(-)